MELVESPISRLSQQLGPFETEWSLYADRLEVHRRGPFGLSRTVLELSRIDCLSEVQAPPSWLLAAGGAIAILAMAFLPMAMSASASHPLVWILCGAVLACGLAAAVVREEQVLLETVGGKQLRLQADRPGRTEVAGFLRLLRQLRAQDLDPAGAFDLLEEGGDEWPEGDAADEGPIDPRWIN